MKKEKKTEKKTGRRAFLTGLGAAGVLVAGGTVYRAVTAGVFSTGTGPAYEPWKSWGTDIDDPLRALVHGAVLSANPHNTQPWLFRFDGNAVDLFADTARNIGSIDPFLREMHVGLGCALENLSLTATALGIEPRLTFLPNPADPTHVARVGLVEGMAERMALFEAIGARHTNRGPYDTARPVPKEALLDLSSLADTPDVGVVWFATDEEKKSVGDLIISATEAIIRDKGQSHDSAHWYRFTWEDVQTHRDGITTDAVGLPGWLRAVSKMLPPLSEEKNDQFWLKGTRDVHVKTASAFGIITAKDPTGVSQRIGGGMLWQRMHLAGTTMGLGMQPINQMTERVDREIELSIEPVFGNALRDLLGNTQMKPLMTFRVGYPLTEALASPRRALEDVIIGTA